MTMTFTLEKFIELLERTPQAVHNLNYLTQIARVMAFQYKSEVGPRTAYLGILQNRQKQ